MSISISSALSTASVAVPNSSSTAAAQRTQQPAIQSNAEEDTVRLTESQQVYQLYTQGLPVSQIAANLNLTVSDVNSYLGIFSAAS